MSKKFLNFSTSKESLKAFILLLNAFVWFFITSMKLIPTIVGSSTISTLEEIIVGSGYYSAIVISAIIGSILASKFDRFKFIYSWIIIGAILSPTAVLLNDFTFLNMLIITIILGVSLGVGMPSCLAYFAETTTFENRGLTSGLTLLFTNLIAAFFIIGFTIFDLNINSILLIFTIWRATALVTFFLKEGKKQIISEKKKNPSIVSVIQDKSFLLFLIAWLMFCLIDRFETPIQEFNFGYSYNEIIISGLGPLLASIAALIGGVLADRIGRKKILLYTFAIMGAAYAINGVFAAQETLGMNLLNGISLSVLSIAGGIMWVLFILVIWGDLAKFVSSEKYFAIGIAPFFLSYILGSFSAEYLMKIIEPTRAFSLAAVFLFLAIIPLWISPETLPEKKIELRRLRNFADEAKRLKEKFENKKLN